ncbi:MAG: Flagellar hook protein FlgE [Pseudomonadota bacterium]|jgi:flagellar hook-basal body protein
MSFYTSLTGLNAATAQLAVTSNNIANVGTTGFKRSRADFGDIFATSPLQKASSVIGQGVALKQVSQEFSQGNIQFSANALDIAITGDGFFPLKSADGLQDIYTRNGTFMLNDSYNVVNSAGQALIAAAVDSSGKADLNDLSKLTIPRKTNGDAIATSQVMLGLNFPSDAKVPALPFDRNDPTTYNKTTAVTVYDSGGNGYLATVYYRKTQVATPDDATNKWQTYVYIGNTKLQEMLIQSSDKNGDKQYVNKYGEIRSESDIPPQDIARGVTKLFNLDDLKNPARSEPASKSGGVLSDQLITDWKEGITFPNVVSDVLAAQTAPGKLYSPVYKAQSYVLTDSTKGITFPAAGEDPVTSLEELADMVNNYNLTATDANKITYKATINASGDMIIMPADEQNLVSNLSLKAVIDSYSDSVVPVSNDNGVLTFDEPAITPSSYTISITNEGDTFTYQAADYKSLAALVRQDFPNTAVDNNGKLIFESNPMPLVKLTAAYATGAPAEVLSDNETSNSLDQPARDISIYEPTTGAESYSLTIGSETYSGADLSALAANAKDDENFSVRFFENKLYVVDKDGTDATTLSTISLKSTTAPEVTSASDATAGTKTFTELDLTTLNLTNPTASYTLSIKGREYTGTLAQIEAAVNANESKVSAAVSSGALVLTDDDLTDSIMLDDITLAAAVTSDTAESTGVVTAFDPPYSAIGYTLALQTGGTPYAGDTLADLATAINADTGNTGVTASIVDSRLILTAAEGVDLTTVTVDAKILDAVNFTAVDSGGMYVITAGDVTYSAKTLPELETVINDDNKFVAVFDPTSNSIKLAKQMQFTPTQTATGYTLSIGSNTYTGTTISALVASINNGEKFTASLEGSDVLVSDTNALTGPVLADVTLNSVVAGSNYDMDVLSQNNAIKFDLNVDESLQPVTVDMSYLNDLLPPKNKFTGVEIARELTKAINKSYGDEKFFDFKDQISVSGSGIADLFILEVGGVPAKISLTQDDRGLVDLSKVTVDDAVKAIQAEIDKVTTLPTKVTVSYDPVRQSFAFKAKDEQAITIRAVQSRNDLFGLTSTKVSIDPEKGGTWGASVLPQGQYLVENETDHRYGVEVKFDEANKIFTISSGTTGDTSSLEIPNASAIANALFGLQLADGQNKTDTSAVPLRGITSQPAVLNGNAIGINLDNKFQVDSSNNQFVVTVDNVTGLIVMPERSDYTEGEFVRDLENRINALADNYGRTVNGVKVTIETIPGTNNKTFKFTTGTAGDNSFLKVSANSIWGLTDLPSARGSTSRWLQPPQAKNADGFPLYVDRDGMETSNPGTFSEDETRDLWSPVFLDKGELTFDTAGKLKSPMESIAFKSFTDPDSGSTLQFSIDYASSTQYSSPFSVNKQDQNGRPEGDLIGVDISDDGLVSASYSNGSQKSLAKVVLVNFASPTGLRQIGDASYYATSKSGDAKYGEAGSAGFGTVRAGARERANVDLTAELIELITAQRNFQANAKAIETNNTLTQAIINIRS